MPNMKTKTVGQSDVFLLPLYVCSVTFFQPFSTSCEKAYLRWEQKLEICNCDVRVFLDLPDCLVHRLIRINGANRVVFKKTDSANRVKCQSQVQAENRQRAFISAELNSLSFCLLTLPAFPIVTGVTMRWIISQIVQSFQYSGIHMNSPYSQLKSTAKKVRTTSCSCCGTDKRYFSDLPNCLNSSAICTSYHAWSNKSVLFAGAKTADHLCSKLLAGYSSFIYSKKVCLPLA